MSALENLTPDLAIDLERRMVAHSDDRVDWLRARSRGVTATDVASLSTARSIHNTARAKLFGSNFSGNAYTEYGREREPALADWVRVNHGIDPCGALYRSRRDQRHLATPDGLSVRDEEIVLAEIKTTNKPWRSIPRNYLRQVWWQQYVIGASRTLFVWEEHRDFVALHDEPRHVWIERDEEEIGQLLDLADQLITEIRRINAKIYR